MRPTVFLCFLTLGCSAGNPDYAPAASSDEAPPLLSDAAGAHVPDVAVDLAGVDLAQLGAADLTGIAESADLAGVDLAQLGGVDLAQLGGVDLARAADLTRPLSPCQGACGAGGYLSPDGGAKTCLCANGAPCGLCDCGIFPQWGAACRPSGYCDPNNRYPCR